ncbi:FAD dependent oxidoreductase [Syncephalis plumigaleata]|nr:FAD dependent oxidoreductase [Syncephalis plumigaleata]
MLFNIDSSAGSSIPVVELPNATDILIIGAGIAGLAAAHGIARIQPSCRILVVEQAPTICSVTTAAAGGGFRCWWPESAEMGRLARTSIALMREEINDGDATSIEFLDDGYTMLSARTEHTLVYLEQASKASANGGGPIWLNGHPWQPGSPIHLEGNPEDTFDFDAYFNRHDGIDVISCRSIIRQVLQKQQTSNSSSGIKSTEDDTHHQDLALDDVRAMLHVRNAGHLNPVAFGHYIAERAKILGNVTIATNIKLTDIIYESDNHHNSMTNKSKKVVAAAVRDEITNKEQTIQTATIILAVGPYLPILGEQLDIDFAVINEPHGRVLFNDPLAAGPSSWRSWLYWSDPIKVQTGNNPEATSVFPPNIHCRPWCPPIAQMKNSTMASRQFTAVWTYDTQRQAYSSSSEEKLKNAVMDKEFTIPPKVPNEYPANVLQGLLPLFPRLKAYMPDDWSPDQMLDCVHSIHTGYYCKTNNNHPMIGAVSHDNKQHELSGLWVCGALSGHGVMMALGCGQLLAQRLLNKKVIHAESNKASQSQYVKDDYNGLLDVLLGKFIASNALTADQM